MPENKDILRRKTFDELIEHIMMRFAELEPTSGEAGALCAAILAHCALSIGVERSGNLLASFHSTLGASLQLNSKIKILTREDK